jgi:hypothetical protein
MCTDRTKVLVDLVVNLVKADGYCIVMGQKVATSFLLADGHMVVGGAPYVGWRKWKNVPSLTAAILTSTHWWPVRDSRDRAKMTQEDVIITTIWKQPVAGFPVSILVCGRGWSGGENGGCSNDFVEGVGMHFDCQQWRQTPLGRQVL